MRKMHQQYAIGTPACSWRESNDRSYKRHINLQTCQKESCICDFSIVIFSQIDS